MALLELRHGWQAAEKEIKRKRLFADRRTAEV
jgi:hypothetical protein